MTNLDEHWKHVFSYNHSTTYLVVLRYSIHLETFKQLIKPCENGGELYYLAIRTIKVAF